MGSNMQRQAVPLLRPIPRWSRPAWKGVGPNSGMVVTARSAGDGHLRRSPTIVIDNADEYELRKFRGLNERTCQNQKPVVSSARRSKPARSSPTAPRPRGRARPRAERARRVHDLRRLQLRGRDRHHRTPRQGRRLHLDPHRRVRSRDPRDQARTRGVHARHPERLREDALATSTTTASSGSAPASARATSWSARSPEEQDRTDARKRSCSTRSSAAPART